MEQLNMDKRTIEQGINTHMHAKMRETIEFYIITIPSLGHFEFALFVAKVSSFFFCFSSSLELKYSLRTK